MILYPYSRFIAISDILVIRPKQKNRLVSGRQPLKKETRSAGMKLFLDTFFGSSIVVVLMDKSTYTYALYIIMARINVKVD